MGALRFASLRAGDLQQAFLSGSRPAQLGKTAQGMDHWRMKIPPQLHRPVAPLNINPSKTPLRNRILIGTPMTGLVRAEWVQARYMQVIPTNWGQVEMTPSIETHVPLGYAVADAENLIAEVMVSGKFEWLWFIEHDNVLPPATFIRMNEYMVEAKVPVVSSLYFTKGIPPEPMVYKEWGWGYHDKWKMGDKVWVRGCPFGCTLIHHSIIKALWDEAPEYLLNNQIIRRVFVAPNDQYFDIETGYWQSNSGTSDLRFCRQLIENRIFEKAGWPQYQGTLESECTCGETEICLRHPFLIDTNIFVKHIDEQGTQWPLEVPRKYLREEVRSVNRAAD